MIANNEQLELVRQQLGRAEAALASIATEVRPHSEERYQLLAESYEAMIVELREQIDQYRRQSGSAEGQDALIRH